MQNRQFLFCIVEHMLLTAEVPFTSSLHGRQRRSEREISVRDLQAAVKYGVKEKGFPNKKGEPRWKYTFGDVTYITDVTSTLEITSWALELPLTAVSVADKCMIRHREACSRILEDPGLITSHTVLVVDMSGSMNKSDMNGHRSRARGVYYNIAMEMVETKLYPLDTGLYGGPSTAYTDVVTLIEMRGEPEIVFSREPLSWILFNKFVALADLKDAHDHGNYYPSLSTAFSVLSVEKMSQKCALAMFFFTDGKPSDYYTTPWQTRDEITDNILDLVLESCIGYGDRLTFTAFGFGKSESEFDLLKAMVARAKAVGVKSNFGYSYSDDHALGNILTLTAQSLTKTRSLLSTLNTAHAGHCELRVKSDKEKSNYDPLRQCNSED